MTNIAHGFYAQLKILNSSYYEGKATIVIQKISYGRLNILYYFNLYLLQ